MTDYSILLRDGDRTEIGTTPTPEGLGPMLAHALREAEKQGHGRLGYDLVVDEGDRDPTNEEIAELDEALETAEADLAEDDL